jgi:hypothetical protein
MKRWCATTSLSFCALALLLGAGFQELRAQVNVTTAHQDIPAVCTGCVYRTGQDLQESTITYSNLSDSTFQTARLANFATTPLWTAKFTDSRSWSLT